MEENEKYCYPYNIIHKAVKLSEEIRAEGDYLRSGGSPEDMLAIFICYMFYGLDMRKATQTLDTVRSLLPLHSIVGECLYDECEKPLERVKNMNERYIKRMGKQVECRAIYSEESHLGQCGNCDSVLTSYDLYEVETCPECGAHIIEVFEF